MNISIYQLEEAPPPPELPPPKLKPELEDDDLDHELLEEEYDECLKGFDVY